MFYIEDKNYYNTEDNNYIVDYYLIYSRIFEKNIPLFALLESFLENTWKFLFENFVKKEYTIPAYLNSKLISYIS